MAKLIKTLQQRLIEKYNIQPKSAEYIASRLIGNQSEERILKRIDEKIVITKKCIDATPHTLQKKKEQLEKYPDHEGFKNRIENIEANYLRQLKAVTHYEYLKLFIKRNPEILKEKPII